LLLQSLLTLLNSVISSILNLKFVHIVLSPTFWGGIDCFLFEVIIFFDWYKFDWERIRVGFVLGNGYFTIDWFDSIEIYLLANIPRLFINCGVVYICFSLILYVQSATIHVNPWAISSSLAVFRVVFAHWLLFLGAIFAEEDAIVLRIPNIALGHFIRFEI